MRGKPKNRAYETFEFPPELGQRLRELRKRAGLTQRQLAVQMGRKGRGSENQVSHLELGRLKFPTLALVADFLRGCGVGFVEIADILNAYTSRGSAVEVAGTKAVEHLVRNVPKPDADQVLAYDRRRMVARRFPSQKQPEQRAAQLPGAKKPDAVLPEKAEARAARVQRMYAKRWIQQQVEDAMFRELEGMGPMLPKEHRAPACEHGRKVFEILQRTRKDDMLKRHDKLHRELRRALAEGDEDWVLARIAAAVEREFEKLERSGWLDRMPSGTEIGQMAKQAKLFSVLRADARMQANEDEAFQNWARRKGGGRTSVWLEVNRKLDQEGMSSEWKNAYFEPWVSRLFDIVMETEPGEEREARVEELLTGQKLEERAREMAPGILEQCEKWKAFLGAPPPRP